MKRFFDYILLIVFVGWLITSSITISLFNDERQALNSLRIELSAMHKEILDMQTRLGNVECRLQQLDALYNVAQCESGLVHDGQWGDHGKAYGILQFHERTFDWLSVKADFKGSWMNRRDQISLGLWAFGNGYGDLWTCYKKMERKGRNDHNG